MAKIRVEFKNGKMTSNIENHTGASCGGFLRGVLRVLGLSSGDTVKKPEYHQPETNSQAQAQR
jgi:hypothetical protein